MDQISKYIQILWNWLKKNKSKWLTFIAVFTLFFIILFPYQEAVSYFINKLNNSTKNSIQFKYESFYINPLGPFIVFNKPEIITKTLQNNFQADQIKIRPSYKSLLQFKLGGIVFLKWPNSLMQITISRKKAKNKSFHWLTHVKSPYFNLSDLHFLSPIFNKIKGTIDIDTKILLDPNFVMQPEGHWSINSNSFQSQALSYTFPGIFGSITLPTLKWTQVSLQGKVKKGDIIISDFSFGDQKDPFQLKARGIISIDFLKQGMSKKIRSRLKSYHMGLDIFVNKEIEPHLSSFLVLFKSLELQTPQGWRYLGEIRGNMATYDAFRTKTLPTLQQIQNPEMVKEKNL